MIFNIKYFLRTSLRCLRCKPHTEGIKIAGIAILFLGGLTAHANPLFTAEEPLAEPGKLRIDYALSYNLNNKSVDGTAASSETIQFVPTFRYGIGAKTDVALIPSFSTSQDQAVNASSNSTRRNALTLAVSHSFLADKGPNGLIGSISTPLVESIDTQGKKYVHLRSVAVGLTKYYLIDPISLSANASITAFRGVKINDVTFKPGPAVTIGFDLGFAVNRNVTLYGGFAWATALRGQSPSSQSLNRTSGVTPSFGVGYRDDAGTLWGLSLTSSNSNGSSILLNITPGASRSSSTLKNTP